MAVYREAYKTIEAIKGLSQTIHPDAFDYGALTKKGDKLWQAVEQLADWYGNKETRVHSSYGSGSSTTIMIKTIEEWQTGNEEHYKITYNKFDKEYRGADGFFEVELVKIIPSTRKYDMRDL